MIDRRMFILGTLAAGGLLASCGPPAPGAVTVNATGRAGMNPGPDGADRPLTLQILQLRDAGSFDGADFFALQNPAAALGADLVKVDQIALAPGGTARQTVGIEPGTNFVAIVAGYRDPAGKVFRVRRQVAETTVATFAVDVGPGGITVS